MEKTAKKQGYHHGDLQAALINAGLRLLESSGDGDIGLRDVAREAGVSATAVYRHFPDKAALFAGLAEEGFHRLSDAQHRAAESCDHAGEAFRAIGKAYVMFAVENAALFRVMTRHMHLIEGADAEGNPASRNLRARIDALMPGADDRTRRIAAIQAWSLVHGLAMLILGGQVPGDPELIDIAVGDLKIGYPC